MCFKWRSLDIFGNEERLAEYRLAAPRVVRFQRKVEKLDWVSIGQTCLTEEQLARKLVAVVRKGA